MTETKFSIFNLEQKLLNCWRVTDDIDEVFGYVCESQNTTQDQDKISNMLLGMKELYTLKFNGLWDEFEKLCAEYHSSESYSNFDTTPYAWVDAYGNIYRENEYELILDKTGFRPLYLK